MAYGSTNTNGHLAAELDAHIANKTNPHGVTAAQVGAAAAKHTHGKEDITGEVAKATEATTAEGLTTFTIAQDADLNTLKGSSYWGKVGVAETGNTCLNKPGKLNALALLILKGASAGGGYTIQMVFGPSANVIFYRRGVDSGEWGAWAQVYPSDHATKADSATDNTKLPLAGGTVTGTLVLSKNTDASGTANNSPALIVGGPATGAHMELDANEIMAKSDGTTPTQLNINTDGGLVQFGAGGISSQGTINLNNHRILGVQSPTNDNDAATKIYVDRHILNADFVLESVEPANSNFSLYRLGADAEGIRFGEAILPANTKANISIPGITTHKSSKYIENTSSVPISIQAILGSRTATFDIEVLFPIMTLCISDYTVQSETATLHYGGSYAYIDFHSISSYNKDLSIKMGESDLTIYPNHKYLIFLIN